jgi:hypothetical protein
MAASSTRLGDVPAAARRTAQRLLAAAAGCDRSTLMSLARSGTSLGQSAAAAFAIPDADRRYAILATLLTRFTPVRQELGESPTEWYWPRAASEYGYTDDTSWAEVVAGGLLTSAQATTMRQQGAGYTGWRVVIGGDGAWLQFRSGS